MFVSCKTGVFLIKSSHLSMCQHCVNMFMVQLNCSFIPFGCIKKKRAGNGNACLCCNKRAEMNFSVCIKQSDERSRYGGWRFAHTIGLIQHTKAAHCVEEMWAIAEMNSNWKVWMASLIESKHAERQIIFCSRLFMLVLVGLSHCFHVRESCQRRNYCSGSFFVMAERKGLFFCLPTLLPGRKRTLIWYGTCCHPPGSADAGFPRQRRHEMCPAARLYSMSGRSHLNSLSSDHPGRHVLLAAPYKSIQPGTHARIVNSYKPQLSLRSSSGLFEIFPSRDGKVISNRDRKTLVQPFRI